MMLGFTAWLKALTIDKRIRPLGRPLIVWCCLDTTGKLLDLVRVHVKQNAVLQKLLQNGYLVGAVYHCLDDPGEVARGVYHVRVTPETLASCGNDLAIAARQCKIMTPYVFATAEASLCLDADLAIQATEADFADCFHLAKRFGFICS